MDYFIKLTSLLFFLMVCFSAPGQDSTQSQQEDFKEVNDLFDLHYEKARDLRKAKQFDAALAELEVAEGIANQYDILHLESKALTLKGRIFSQTGRYPEALELYEKILQYPEDTISKKQIARVHTEIASIYQNLGEFPEAINYHLKALKVFENIGYTTGRIRSLYEVGRLYWQKGDDDKSLEHFEKSMSVIQENWSGTRDDSTKLFFCYSAIGSAHERLGNLEQSLEYNVNSLDLAKALNDKSYIASALQNLGTNYTILENYESADIHLQEALKLFKSINNKWGVTGTHLYLGKLHAKWDQLPLSLKYLNDGLDHATEMESKDRIMEFFISLADTYKLAGDFESSDRFLRNYIALRETVINESSILEIKEAQWDYTSFKQQHKIELLEKDKEVSRLRTIGILILLSFCLSALFIFYKWNQKQREVNLLLEEKSQEIAKTNQELEQVNEELKQFTSVASHDLKEPLRTITTFMSLLQRHYGHQFEAGAQDYFKFIKEASQRMQALLEDLLAYSRIGRKEKPEEWVDANEIIKITLANLQSRIQETDAQIQVNYESIPKIKANSSQLVQVFQNIVSNGLKFQTDQRPIIQIDCAPNGNYFLFSIKDNGIGIPYDKKEKIFEMFSRLHNRSDYEGTGIGLPTCKKIIERHGGSIWVDSVIGQGSTFYFTIPKKSVRVTKLPKENKRKLLPTG